MEYFSILSNTFQFGNNANSTDTYKFFSYGQSQVPSAIRSQASTSDPPASIHVLPVEILQDIFVDYCTIDIQQYAEDAKRYKRESLVFPPFHPDRLRCRLSLVCRLWASILKRTPRVWTQLVFLDYIPGNTTISRWLKWSEPLSLELLILLWKPEETAVAEDFLRLLSSHVPRFRFLMAEFSRDNQFQDLLSEHLFPAGQIIRMPELKSLHLHQFFPSPTLPVMGSIVAPELLRLSLMSGYQSGAANLVCERLEHVRLVLTDNIAQDFKFLFEVKRIQTLDIELVVLPTTFLYTTFRPSSLTNLKLAIHLPFHVFLWDNITAVFERLEFPALEILDISVMGHLTRRDASPSIRSLVAEKSCRIQEFTCAHLSLGTDLYNIFAHLPQLKKISLLSCFIEESFFQRFIEWPSFPTIDVESYLCPVLEEIHLAPCVRFSIGPLEQLLRSREDIVVLITLNYIEMGVNDWTALMSLQETYTQFAVRVNATNLWTQNEYVLSLKYLGKAFSMLGLLPRP